MKSLNVITATTNLVVSGDYLAAVRNDRYLDLWYHGVLMFSQPLQKIEFIFSEDLAMKSIINHWIHLRGNTNAKKTQTKTKQIRILE